MTRTLQESTPSPAEAASGSTTEERDGELLQRPEGALPVVGLGGSAGGIAALQRFFTAMPADSGMAFVVILHLSPQHESTLAQLLQRSTAMPVAAATDGVVVEPNSVYVIPPGKFLVAAHGYLALTDVQEPRGKRVAVDTFFRTLAETYGAQSLAVVLSGDGGDGALGMKRIKELGGLTIAQDPDEAEHPEMPRSAIATGVVDWVLGMTEMPAKLLAYVKQRGELQLPGEQGPHPSEAVGLSPDEHEEALRDVLAFLHMRTGRDFSCYKRATILRRIARRMQVNGLSHLPGYLAYLRTHAGEAGALLQDLLISVTNFFRDPAAFAALERTIPELFKGKGPGDTVRVWVAGCATGEEAYSIAMLLCEHAGTLVGPPHLQVFATDLDEEVIREARDGLYPETIAADVSEERLKHFFVHEQGAYRVRRAVREIVLFAPHDLLKDSPFSRLDLVSCRNLLIYLNRSAQSRAFDIFSFALRPGGRLFLGTSEAVDEGSSLFAVLDKKQRLYVQRAASQHPLALPAAGLPSGQVTSPRALALQERPLGPGRTAGESEQARLNAGGALESWLSPVELHYRLIERFSPPSILVSSAHDMIHLSESAGRFLHFTGGEPTRNLLLAVHPMLRVELRAALYAAVQTCTVATALRVPVETGDARSLVDLRVTPAGDLAPGALLVVFDEHPAHGAAAVAPPRNADADQAALALERELVATKAQLRETIEQAEASTEELKASNEELQAMNEELRSATEELETSREELQSINEELSTVNDELKSTVERVAQSNSDLQNLMAATNIATVFLDRELRIKLFTPSAKTLFNLLSTDLGRPLSDLNGGLDYPEIVADAERSLAHLQPSQRQVRAGERWYIARTLPYRTENDHIAGVVLTFVDNTEQKRIEEEIVRVAAESDRQRRFYEAILTSTPDFVYVFSLDHKVLYANEALIRMWGRGRDGAIGKTFLEVGYEPWHAAMHDREIDQVRATRQPIRGEVPFTGTHGRRHYDYIFVPILGADGEVEAVAGTTRDVTERKEAEERQAFLVRLADSLRRLSDPTDVQAEVSRALGVLLGANRVAYFEVRGDSFVVDRDYADGVPSVVGHYPVTSFGADLLATYRAGHTAMEADVVRLPALTPEARAAFAGLQIVSFVGVPLVKDGLLVGGLTVHAASARTWTPAEISIIEETAERTWAAVERVRAEVALRQSEERLAFVRRSSGVGVWYCDLPFDVLEWDELVKAHFHLPPDAVVTIQTFYDRIHPDDREPTREAIEQSIANRTSYDVYYRTVDPVGGAVKWVRAIGRTSYAGDGTPIQFDGVTLDVSDQKRAEASLRASEARLRDADRRKDEFLAILAHELRNPLAPMRNGLEVIRMVEASEVVERARAMMDRQLAQLARLVDDLVDVSRVTSGKLELRRERLQLRAVIDAAVETSRTVIEQAGHALVVAVPDEPMFVNGDHVRLAQVVSNLLHNSAKYTHRGGHIRLAVERQGDTALVSVQDDGIGIPPAMLGSVFEMFTQVDRTLEKTTGGLGIGLSLVKRLVEMHGGTIEGRSEGEGRGAEFVIRLPIAAPDSSQAAPQERAAKDVGKPGLRRILVVDDNEDAADLLGELLEMLGHEVRKAYDGEAAVQAAGEFQPAVVFCDLGMPKVNGYEAVRRIREQPWSRHTVIVALTGWGDEAVRKKSADAGFDFHLVKPVAPAALRKLLASLPPPPA